MFICSVPIDEFLPHAVILVKQLDEATADLFLVECILDLLSLVFVFEFNEACTRSSAVILFDVDLLLCNVSDFAEELLDLAHLHSEWKATHGESFVEHGWLHDVGELESFPLNLASATTTATGSLSVK